MIHVADRHVSPGKKQWTWGSGEFGKAWDRQLTDEDGPYFELMCGVYTDNQPDFSWIMPNEVREFKQYYMPYKNIGYIKNASVDAIVNFEINDSTADIKVYVTKERVAKILLKQQQQVIYEKTLTLSPTVTYEETIPLQQPVASPENYCVEVLDEQGQVLISYSPIVKHNTEIPDPATAIPEPSELKTNEELYLAGLHLEQYRHATYCAEDYYKEAIRRSPSDIRNNNALGLLFLRRGEYQRSEKYFRSAIEKLNKHNPNPYDSEPLYNLGLALQYQGRYREAYALLYKSTWSVYLQDNAFLQLAFIEAGNENWNQALSFVKDSLARNLRSPKARHLHTIILRRLGRWNEARIWAIGSLELDAFNFGSRYELYKVFSESGNNEEATKALEELQRLMRGCNNNYIEIAIDYANAGLYADAFDLLHLIAESNADPLTCYYLGYYKYYSGDTEAATHWFKKGFYCSPDRVFPNRLEDIDVL
jgi:tetratricopeptide (TPR) repeat protein